MTQRRIPLAELKEQMEVILGRPTLERLPCSRLPSGIPRGSLIELTGFARVEWLLAFLKEHPELKVCWIEEKFNLLPTAFHQRGAGLDRFLFVEAGEQLFSVVRKALRSHVFEVLVCPSQFEEDRVLKALQLFAEKSNTAVFLLGTQPKTAWQISLQLECAALDSVRILKQKKGGYES
jgi:hypothetical protein